MADLALSGVCPQPELVPFDTPAPRHVQKLGLASLCGVAVIEAEETADTLASPNGPRGMLPYRAINELVAQPLVIAFTVVMRHEVGKHPPKMPEGCTNVIQAATRYS